MITMCGALLKEYKKANDLMLILGLKETNNWLSQCLLVCLCLRREDGHVWRRTSDFEAESQRKKRRQKRTWKKRVMEESIEDFLVGKIPFADQNGVLASTLLSLS